MNADPHGKPPEPTVDAMIDALSRAQDEITRLREMLNHFGRLAEQDHNHLTAEIERLRTALATRASDPAP